MKSPLRPALLLLSCASVSACAPELDDTHADAAHLIKTEPREAAPEGWSGAVGGVDVVGSRQRRDVQIPRHKVNTFASYSVVDGGTVSIDAEPVYYSKI